MATSSNNIDGNGTNGTLTKLLFHPNHGENVGLTPDRQFLFRKGINSPFSDGKGIAFSDRPVRVKEKVYVKFWEVSSSVSGVFRFGFTKRDPKKIPAGLAGYPALTRINGFWLHILPDSHVRRSNVLSYHVSSEGDVFFQINGEDKAVFFSGVDVKMPLWAVVDMFGQSSILKIVDATCINKKTRLPEFRIE